MRTFTSYGPADASENFCVARSNLIERCVEQLIGQPAKSGHYFTIWAPRQTGKTWLMRRAVEAIRERYGEKFLVGSVSIQNLDEFQGSEPDMFFRAVPMLFQKAWGFRVPPPASWREFSALFARDGSPLDRPAVLLIDEFDSLPPALIDSIVSVFRGLGLNREDTWLHGLALIGVRSVLGVDSLRGSPFNIQRSLQVPNLTHDEVLDMFQQYQDESGQQIESEVLEAVFHATRGQPGLVGWFGELLTEKYNPGAGAVIRIRDWKRVYLWALAAEPNNTIMNLVVKARGEYVDRVIRIFGKSDVPFRLDEPWCGYLFMNGIITSAEGENASGSPTLFCRFTCPFIQERLYNALISTLGEDRLPGYPLDPFDYVDDVFANDGLHLSALLNRYKAYLKRIVASGDLPWKGQPRRETDAQAYEAIGHFHLYAWLYWAFSRRCSIIPEFPTGNGTVDLVLRTKEHVGMIEVQSFIDRDQLRRGRAQAARYARKLGLRECVLAVFAPIHDEEVLAALSTEDEEADVVVTTVMIGWG